MDGHPYLKYQGILNEVFARHGVTLAYLYGSQARGDAGSLSDVDIGVLFDASFSDEERFERRLALIGDLCRALERDDVSVVDLADAPPLLRHRVYYDGQILYCPDDGERVRFAVKAIRDYVDTEPLRQIKRRYVLQHFSQSRGAFDG